MWYPTISLWVCYLYKCTEPRGPWSPPPSCTARAAHCWSGWELRHLHSFSSRWGMPERPLPDEARKPQGGKSHLAATEAVPPVCLPAFCPPNVVIFLLWCNTVARHWVLWFAQAMLTFKPHTSGTSKLSKQAWKRFPAGFHMEETQCY